MNNNNDDGDDDNDDESMDVSLIMNGQLLLYTSVVHTHTYTLSTEASYSFVSQTYFTLIGGYII